MNYILNNIKDRITKNTQTNLLPTLKLFLKCRINTKNVNVYY